MSQYEERWSRWVELEERDRMGTLNRPEKRNAMSPTLVRRCVRAGDAGIR